MKRTLLALSVVLAAALAGCDSGEPGVHEITQKDKAFHPDEISIHAGETLLLHNDDSRTHNIRVFHPKLDFNSGSQEPGEDVRITFDEPGTYYVTCGIHTQMELKVTVTPQQEAQG